jgi:hypothetical protein
MVVACRITVLNIKLPAVCYPVLYNFQLLFENFEDE